MRVGAPSSRYVAPYVQSPPDVVDRMLALAGVRAGDILYDLGSGDGRIVLAAARAYGIKAVGLELDPDLVADSRKVIVAAGLESLAEIRPHDILTADFSAATILTLYLEPQANLRLRPRIVEQLRRGARIVSHEFDMGAWKPARVEQMTDASGVPRTLYLWRR
jgi:predicted RNA methylase